MELVKFLNDNWFVLGSIGSAFIWIMRLQSRVDILEMHRTVQEEHKEEIWNKMDSLNNTLITVLQSVAELKGVIIGKEQK